MTGTGACSTHNSIDTRVYQTLALGFLWAWVLFMGNPSGLILGIAYDHSATYRSFYQLATAIFMVACSFIPLPQSAFSFKCQAWAGAAGCIGSCLLFRLGYALDSSLAITASSVLVAASFVVLIRCWCWRCTMPLREALVTTFSAGSICLLAQLATSVYGSTVNTPLAIICALFCAIALVRSTPARTEVIKAAPAHADRRPFCMEFASIVLCTLASAFLHFGIIGGDETWAYFSLVALAGLAFALAWRWSNPSPYLFCGIVLFACTCTLLAAMGIPAVSSLAASAFWLLSVYGTTWAYDADCRFSRVPGALFLRALAVQQACMALPKLLDTRLLPDTTVLLVSCTAALAVGIGLFLMGAFSGPAAIDRIEYPADDHNRPRQTPPTQGFKDAYGLTDREYDVLASLARGNSLRKTAELLALSEGAVKYHRHNVYMKLSITSRQELIDLVGASDDPKLVP